MFGVGKKKAETPKATVHAFVVDMADFLVGYGFHIEDALKISQEFYDRNKGKIRDAISIF